MQGDHVPLIQAINRLTSLLRLGLDLKCGELEGPDASRATLQQRIVRKEVVQLRLPSLRDLSLCSPVRVDARACPLLQACGRKKHPSGFQVPETLLRRGKFPTDCFLSRLEHSFNWDKERFDRCIRKPALSRYASRREDGIEFARPGSWRRVDSYEAPGREHPHWEWTPDAL